MREIVNQCRAGLLAIGIAHQISKLYCDDQSLDCDILDLFACSLVSVGMTYTQTREIHIHLNVKKPKKNDIKTFQLFSLNFLVPNDIHDLQIHYENADDRVVSDILTPKVFQDSKTSSQSELSESGVTTVELDNLPIYVFVENDHIIGQYNHVPKDIIFADEISRSDFKIINSTLTPNFGKLNNFVNFW